MTVAPEMPRVIEKRRKASREDLSKRGYSEVVVGNTVVFVKPLSADVIRTSEIIVGRVRKKREK